MILIVSHPEDYHTRVVMDELHRLGAEVKLLDLSLFPMKARITFAYPNASPPLFAFQTLEGETIDFSTCRAAWWRRPQGFMVDSRLSQPGHIGFAFNEALEAFTGLWHALNVFWVNNPARDEVAHKKTYQLAVAQQVGLHIPETLVTNDPEQARAFAARHRPQPIVYKTFSATEQLWRETRVLQDGETRMLDAVQYAPVIFQEYVPGVDIRVTIVGDQLFAAEIDISQGQYPVDFRMNMSAAKITATELPAEIAQGLSQLMASLGIVYGAADLRRTPDGQYIFLEVNPAGQWLFVEEHTRQPISRALAELLANHDGASVAATVAAKQNTFS